MPLITAVSFDEDGIRVISGRRKGAGFTVEQALTVAHDELDAFLSIHPADDYLVAVNLPDTLYETITIPPADAKLTATLVKAETARLHPELLPFSCASQVVGDLPMEGRTVRKVACCLVPHERLAPILEPFIRNHKTIQCLVTAPLALAPMVAPLVVNTSDALLCAHDAGDHKILFLVENGAVSFARALSSNGPGWDAFDRQNISMTMDYCFQSLRIRPARVLVLNPDQVEDDQSPPPRLEPLTPPANVNASSDVFHNYLVPLMLAVYPVADENNLLPVDYSAERQQQTFLHRATLAFAAGILALTILIGMHLYAMLSLQETITSLKRTESGLDEVYRSHREAMALRDSSQPLIAAMNGILAPADIPRLLVALNGIKTPGVSLQTLTLKRDKDSIGIQMTGSLAATSYAATQQQFEGFTPTIKKIPGVSLGNHQLDPKAQTFTLEGAYKP